jgi:hypothetical protein
MDGGISPEYFVYYLVFPIYLHDLAVSCISSWLPVFEVYRLREKEMYGE